MTLPNTCTRPTIPRADDGCTHVVNPADDPNRALCGLNATDLPWHAGPAQAECAVCVAVEEAEYVLAEAASRLGCGARVIDAAGRVLDAEAHPLGGTGGEL